MTYFYMAGAAPSAPPPLPRIPYWLNLYDISTYFDKNVADVETVANASRRVLSICALVAPSEYLLFPQY